MQDENEYAKLSQLKAGSFVRVDVGFDCIDINTVRLVKEHDSELYIDCSHGKHFLKGQIETDNDSLIGIYHV